MKAIEKELKQSISGEVCFDELTRRIYSVDASIYEVMPIGVIFPKSEDDIIKALIIAESYKLAVIARGAATGLTGGAIGKGLIIDTSKYLNQIIEVNFEKEYAICEVGVVQKQLNDYLAPHGYRLGPDTSTGNRATIGGMIGNNSSGINSLRFGMMKDHILELKMLLASGESLSFKEISTESWHDKRLLPGTEGKIYRELYSIAQEYRIEIEKQFPKLPRRASGYNLDALIDPGKINPCQVICGAEGSLGIVTQAKLKIVPIPAFTVMVIVYFSELDHALEQAKEIVPFNPFAFELIDKKIISMGRLSPSLENSLNWLEETPASLYIIECDGNNLSEARNKAEEIIVACKKLQIGYKQTLIEDSDTQNQVYQLRKSGLGLLLSKRSYSRAIAFIEDIVVPIERLSSCLGSILQKLQEYNNDAGVYGHIGAGLLHMRPYINLKDPKDLEQMRSLMEYVSDLVHEHGGELSGEHGDGFLRSWLNEKMFGEKIYKAFCELKWAFDPNGQMNPGKVVSIQGFDENLRLTPETPEPKIETFLDFEPEGGFSLAVDLCNGNGECRKREGLMCPSFQATGNEFDTTRARAQALRAVVNGKQPLSAFTSHDIYKVLDLCLECKGCKKECPSQVDMAKIKPEFLYQYHKKHGSNLRRWIFANIARLNPLMALAPSISNSLTQQSTILGLMSRFGFAKERPFPRITHQKFSNWIQKQGIQAAKEKYVVLFNDTHTEFNHPHVGKASYKLLQALGYHVIIPKWTCCGRPLISKGYLQQARDQAKRVIQTLLPFAKQGIPIIGMEPSCILTIHDDYPSLLNTKDCATVSLACITLDDFLHDLIPLSLPWNTEHLNVRVHGHCHQKALKGMDKTLDILNSIPGYNASLIETGCCGLAGSFGYEQEHYSTSMQIGESKLFPLVRECKNHKALIIANGTSCRQQIDHGTGVQAMHLAEALLRSYSSS
jgi:FAD/FMN-containing dehydrogenase/Fe-S oxidoreductase